MAVNFTFKYFFRLLVIRGAAFNSGMVHMAEEHSSCGFILIKSVLMVVLFLLLSEVLLSGGSWGGQEISVENGFFKIKWIQKAPFDWVTS